MPAIPTKRKHPPGDLKGPRSHPPTTEPTRRATRQTPIPPPIIPTMIKSPPRPAAPVATVVSVQTPVPTPLPPPKRGRGRPRKQRPSETEHSLPVDTNKATGSVTTSPVEPPPVVPVVVATGRRLDAQKSSPALPANRHHPPTSPTQQQTRVTRQRAGTMIAVDSRAIIMGSEAKENMRPINGLVAPKITYQAPQPHSQPWTRNLMRPSPPTTLPPSLQQQQQQQQQKPHPSLQSQRSPGFDQSQHSPIARDQTQSQGRAPLTTTPIPIPSIPHTPRPHAAAHSAQQAQNNSTQSPHKPPPRADRNIDKVVLGDICFRTWYPSYYGKELLGDTTAFSAKNLPAQANGAGQTSGTSVGPLEDGAKTSTKRSGDAPLLDRLYVCPMCFKYSKELVAWLTHVRVCERTRTTPPGRKVYTHPKGRRTVTKMVPEIKRGPGKKSSAGMKQVDELVSDEGEWSVWEVDGEHEGLFCQNLSLFAKLFLDNKSVFFDVTGFNYFLLVYTPAPQTSNGAAAAPPLAPLSPDSPSASTLDSPRPRIVGFFSKEKMSWDNNNLACILVFPPWQRKGLGALLMGVSYEISRRERILGGPEKPISDLGRKGYRRFWAGEIARWLLGINGVASRFAGQAEVLIDVNDVSQATWIAQEDCLATLREMGVIQAAGMGPGKQPEPTVAEDVEMADAGEAGAEEQAEVEEEPVPQVSRVQIDKEAVRRWVLTNGISLELVCDPNGFAEGYAMKAATPSDMED